MAVNSIDKNKIPVISIMGWSGSGKTTLIERMLLIFRDRGMRVAVLKHDSHGFDMDREGKDTWRFSQAGAAVVAIASPRSAAFIENRELSIEDMISRVRDADLIITEGYKSAQLPKIEVSRMETGKPLYEKPENLLAIVTDIEEDYGIPRFLPDDAEGVAKFITDLFSISGA